MSSAGVVGAEAAAKAVGVFLEISSGSVCDVIEYSRNSTLFVQYIQQKKIIISFSDLITFDNHAE